MKFNRITIIEDNPEISEIFSLLIQQKDAYILVNTYDNSEEALENLAQDKPDIVLMDVDLPGIDGIECTRRLKKIFPQTKVIMITVFENSKTVFDALCAGATWYLSKNTDKEKLMNAIDEVVNGGAPMSTHIAKMEVKSFHLNQNSPLSSRESEILSQLTSGKSYGDIAEHLTITKDTVKFHIKNIYLKLQVGNKAEAIEKASKDRLI